jgi:hypothetical protein
MKTMALCLALMGFDPHMVWEGITEHREYDLAVTPDTFMLTRDGISVLHSGGSFIVVQNEQVVTMSAQKTGQHVILDGPLGHYEIELSGDGSSFTVDDGENVVVGTAQTTDNGIVIGWGDGGPEYFWAPILGTLILAAVVLAGLCLLLGKLCTDALVGQLPSRMVRVFECPPGISCEM